MDKSEEGFTFEFDAFDGEIGFTTNKVPESREWRLFPNNY